MPLYRFKCCLCDKSWEAYRTSDNQDTDYCCGVEARLDNNVEPQSMALENLDEGHQLQMHKFKG